MLHSPQKSIKFVNLHYFSTKKLKSLRSRLPILKAFFGQKPDFVNTSTLGLPWEYCASTLGVLCKYWPSPLLGHHTHQQFQQVPSFDNHTAGHTYTEQVCSAKYCRIAFLKIWIFKNLILSIF